MARTTGLQAFTVQEATNYEAFTSWDYETIDLESGGAAAQYIADYITSVNPAKKVVIYDAPLAATSLEANDVLTITINGETGTGKPIVIDIGDLPFTLSGLTITSLKIVSAAGAASDTVAVLSFH